MKVVFLSGLLTFALITGLTATEPPDTLFLRGDSLKVYYLGKIVVYPGPDINPGYLSVTSAFCINRKTLKNSNYEDLSDALKMVPGMDITTGYKNQASLKLRGFQPKHTVVLVDGRPVNEPYYGYIDLSSLLIDDISTINVYKGLTPPGAGANAMAGAVNIVSSAPASQNYMRADISYSSGETSHLGLTSGRRFLKRNDEYYYLISVAKNKSDGYPISKKTHPSGYDDTGLRDNSDYDNLNLNYKLGYLNHSLGELGLSLGYYRSEKGIPPAEKGRIDYRRFDDWRRWFIDASARLRKYSKWDIMAKVYYDDYYNTLADYMDDGYSDERLNWYSTHDNWALGFNLDINYKVSKNKQISFTTQVRSESISRQADRDEPWLYNRLVSGSTVLGYAQTISGWFSVYLSLNTSYLTHGQFDDIQSVLNPQLGFQTSLNDNVALRFSILRSSRFPTVHELYSQSSGNSELKSENATKVDFGLDITQFFKQDFKTTLFYSKSKDLIYRKGKGFKYQNRASSYTRGIELSLNGNLTRISYNSSYTFTDSKDGETDNRLEEIPRHRFFMMLNYNPGLGINLGLSFLSVSERPWYDNYTVPSYATFNGQFSKQLGNHLLFYVNVDNIFDTFYYEEYGFSMPGRQISTGIKLTL